ncbi:MAG: type II toxin-antitoxin system prevent-host-death family antitoxin [Chloroflexi bacterium]|nr:type II toxin-antitoxin system prevent-host-death family antitoxin [Chloroflexota bacterium]
MIAMSFTTARRQLAATIGRVNADQEAVVITRNGEEAAVLLSIEEYRALEETSYLLRSPANAQRLLEAIAQLEASKGTERELIE